jgi:hypothetical protein
MRKSRCIFLGRLFKLILFWLLFEGRAIRITPPLTVSEDEIREGCAILLEVLDEILHQKNLNKITEGVNMSEKKESKKQVPQGRPMP